MNAFELKVFKNSNPDVNIISMFKENYWKKHFYFHRFLFSYDGHLILGKVDFNPHNGSPHTSYDTKKEILLDKIQVNSKRAKYVLNNNNGFIHYRSNRHFEIMIAMISDFVSELQSLGFQNILKLSDFPKAMLDMKELCRVKPRNTVWLYDTMLKRLGFDESLFINDFKIKANHASFKI